MVGGHHNTRDCVKGWQHQAGGESLLWSTLPGVSHQHISQLRLGGTLHTLNSRPECLLEKSYGFTSFPPKPSPFPQSPSVLSSQPPSLCETVLYLPGLFSANVFWGHKDHSVCSLHTTACPGQCIMSALGKHGNETGEGQQVMAGVCLLQGCDPDPFIGIKVCVHDSVFQVHSALLRTTPPPTRAVCLTLSSIASEPVLGAWPSGKHPPSAGG